MCVFRNNLKCFTACDCFALQKQAVKKRMALRKLIKYMSKVDGTSGSRRSFCGSVENFDFRDQYRTEEDALLEDNLFSKNPLLLFKNWLDTACNTPLINEPNAMALATVKQNGRPAVRMVLLKGVDEHGFKFYTNFRSNKASDLELNPFAALEFYWVELCRSVRIEGHVKKASLEESLGYFQRRPRLSQLAAHVSEYQSSPLRCRSVLDKRMNHLEQHYPNHNPIPKPEFWGGYIVKPDLFEFWQGHSTRVCDRIVFTKLEHSSGEFLKKGEKGWVFQRLQP